MTTAATLGSSTTLDSDSFGFVCNLVRTRSAIEIEPSKAYLVESRLAPIAREQGLASLRELVAEMRRPGKQDLSRQVVEAMTTNETSFFRDIHPFEALKSQIIPQLVAKRSSERTLNIWSNACSSGQEPFTIAMILREHFAALAGWKVRIIGSDLSSQILARAREGVFNQTEVNRGLPANLMVKYFQRDGVHWRIKDEIRKMVEFSEVNLVETWPTSLPKFDIVFLRNVLIYFSPETKKTILGKVRKILQPDGFLFLGGAETTMNLDTTFVRTQVGKAVCYCLETPAATAKN
ncbi:protein-glutamate O-methyltransferase CheR [Anatilimnocola sp. NA78]|uniref:CheR family methyltransferase n=1 Tax=Anatilimnocola sp. NA78 TaxID=3415683 RepID=UPI003CE5C846